MARSISTIVVASVFEPAGPAVSRIRTTSPPMLLGRKLFAKVATRYETSSALRETGMACAWHRRPQRQLATTTERP